MAISDTQLTSTLANLFAIFLDCTAKFDGAFVGMVFSFLA
jgi:hypothetical protein